MVVRLSAWENAWDTYGERNREAFFDTNYKTFKFFGEKLFPSVWQSRWNFENNSTFFLAKWQGKHR